MVIYNNIIPFKGYKAINLFGFIFARKGCNLTDVDINHERIHTAQIIELLFIGFYLWYFIELLILSIKYRSISKAYRNVKFEKEAYQCQNMPYYLDCRVPYEFLRF